MDVQGIQEYIDQKVNLSDFIDPGAGQEMPEVDTGQLAEYVAGILADALYDLTDEIAAQTVGITSPHAVRDHVNAVLVGHAILLERQAWGED